MGRSPRTAWQAQQDRAHSLYEGITALPSDRLQRTGKSRTCEWPPSPFNAAATFVWVSRSEVSSNSPSRDPNRDLFCWRVARDVAARPKEQSLPSRFDKAAGHPFPPPPVLGRSCWAQPI